MGFLEDIGMCLDSEELYSQFGVVGTQYYLQELERAQFQLKINALTLQCIRICTQEKPYLTAFSPRMKDCLSGCPARYIDSDYITARKLQTRPDNPNELLRRLVIFGAKENSYEMLRTSYDYHIRYPFVYKEGTRFPPEIINLRPLYFGHKNNDPEKPQERPKKH